MNLDQHGEYNASPRKSSRRPGRREREQRRAAQAAVRAQASASTAERVRVHRARQADFDLQRWRPAWATAPWPAWLPVFPQRRIASPGQRTWTSVAPTTATTGD